MLGRSQPDPNHRAKSVHIRLLDKEKPIMPSAAFASPVFFSACSSVRFPVLSRSSRRVYVALSTPPKLSPYRPSPSSPSSAPSPPPAATPRLHPILRRANVLTVGTVVAAVDAIYASPDDAYRRFYTLEVLARIPFFAYACLLHLKETLVGPSDAGTRRLRAHFEQADNEALHLAVMVSMGGGERWLDQVGSLFQLR